jgi:hypothetical protein
MVWNNCWRNTELSRWIITVGMLLTVLPFLAMGCGAQAPDRYESTWEEPADSPSGKYRLIVVKGFNGRTRFTQFQIASTELQPNLLFCCKDYFPSARATYFLWDAQDRVWVYSGDVGAFYWSRGMDGVWTKHIYGQDTVAPPELLRQKKPRFFSYVDGQNAPRKGP